MTYFGNLPSGIELLAVFNRFLRSVVKFNFERVKQIGLSEVHPPSNVGTDATLTWIF